MANLKQRVLVSFCLLGALIIISACSTQTTKPICNKPYILVGNDCCLDKDDNSICDKDELETKFEKEINKQACNKPYIQFGTSCCLDKNDNRICDNDELSDVDKKSNEYEESKNKSLTIEDLQADIGNVIKRVVVFTKDASKDNLVIYSNKISNSKFLGKYGGLHYSKLSTKKPEKVLMILRSQDYLKNKEEFQNFVNKNKDVFIESALKSKEVFEGEFKGELPKIIYLKKTGNKDRDTAEKAKYFNHSVLSSIVYYDDIVFPETVSENIAEIQYVRVNKYTINYGLDDIFDYQLNRSFSRKYSGELSNINYGQSIVIECSPSLIIGLSFENYGDGTVSTYEREYDKSDVDKNYFLTPLRDHYQELIRDSQAIVKMCQQRYSFTYIRER